MEVDPLTGLEVARRGLYVHFPYCLRRCPYCDFAIRIQHDIPHARYATAALRELELRLTEAPEWDGRPLDSLYIGGGTPSLWEPEELGRVLDGVRKRLPLAPGAEVSLEANPEDATVVEMVDGVTAALAEAGLARYEISSYARPGKHSRHNALYWTGGESLALGVGAVGFRRTGEDQGLRTTAVRSTPKWMEAVESGRLPVAEREELGRAELYAERLLLGLRLRSGLDLRALWAASGVPPRNAVVEKLTEDGFLEPYQGRVRLTDRGAHLHAEVTARLL